MRTRMLSWCLRDIDQREDEDDPVIVLLHGAGASMHSWEPLLRAWSAPARMLVVDLPGHGGSTSFNAGGYTLVRTAQALNDLLHELSCQPTAVVGHSAGGAVAMQWRLQQQAPTIASILTINPALLPFNGIAGLAFPLLARLAATAPLLGQVLAARANNTRAIMRLIEGTGSKIDASQIDGYQRLMRKPQHVRQVFAMMAGWQLDDLLPAWQARELPLFVLLAERDRAVPPQRTRQAVQALAHVEMTSLPNAGHLAHEELPHRCAQWILQCLSASS
ncbi:MAG: alpha/beta fold hydrolase BchO [Pseudomonadota bacterium]